MNRPPREFAINPWLKTGESGLIWAASGVGKTWFTLTLALAMAGGGTVADWKVERPRKVLIVDGEMNTGDLGDRLASLVISGAVGGLDVAKARENIFVMPRQYQIPHTEFYDITDPDAQSRILSRMDAFGADVVIIDNLTTCADGLSDENDAAAFRSVMAFLLLMKQAGKTALLVHHANKAGTDARGSTALETTFEVKVGLRKAPEAEPGKASFTLDFGKFRGKGNASIGKQKWTLEAAGWTVEMDESAERQRYVALVQSLKFTSQADLAKHLGVNKMAVSRMIKRAVAHGEITDSEWKRAFETAATLKVMDTSGFEDETDADPAVANADF
ncbi:AAA family ATPase [Phyllobacterium sp. P5_D12]